MKLKDTLIKLGHSNPELRDDLRPILRHIDSSHTRSKKAGSRRIENVTGGGWILGPTLFAAGMINDELHNARLIPFEASTLIDGGTASLLIAVESGDNHDPTDQELDQVAQTIAKRLSGVGHPNVKGEGFHIGGPPSARIILKQKF